LIREAEVRKLLPMSEALRLVEEALRLQGDGAAQNRPRTRIHYPKGVFQYMAAALPSQRAVGLKAYAASASGAQFVVLLFDAETNRLLAIMEADWLGRIRTGAASGVATRVLASPAARVAGVIGAGRQAETQIVAIDAALELETIKVFSRTPERREALAERLRPELRAHIEPVSSSEEAVRESDVVTTITSSGEPVFEGKWLRDGAHVNAAGGNRAGRREVDTDTVVRSSLIAVDSLEQARVESGDLMEPAKEHPEIWSRVVELGAVVAEAAPGRTSERQVTLFESQGIALEDVAVARFVFDRAVGEGVGEEIAFGGGS
jgi:ornithine cyclodeaminase/alanine dehydrogenase-like protein (mu-crystallin family)